MNKSSNMNDSESMEEGGGIDMGEEMKVNETKSINNNGNDLLERIYDEGQGGKFNDLIKNPTKIKAVKAFITEDDIENMLNLPPDKTKTGFNEGKDGGMSGTMNHVSGNMQDLLSITGFKIIDKLPPTSGDLKNKTNSMIDRFRVSFNDFDTTSGNNTLMGATKTKWTNNVNLEPKLSRPTTTIINLGKKYNVNKEESKTKEKKDEIINEQEDTDEDEPLDIIEKIMNNTDSIQGEAKAFNDIIKSLNILAGDMVEKAQNILNGNDNTLDDVLFVKDLMIKKINDLYKHNKIIEKQQKANNGKIITWE